MVAFSQHKVKPQPKPPRKRKLDNKSLIRQLDDESLIMEQLMKKLKEVSQDPELADEKLKLEQLMKKLKEVSQDLKK